MKTIADIREVLITNGVICRSYWTRRDALKEVKKHGLLEQLEEKERAKELDKYHGMRFSKRRVILEDVDTGEKHEFGSLNQASKKIKTCPKTVDNYNGRVYSHEIRFLDSFKLMQSSLESLVSNLKKDDLKTVKKFFKDKKDFNLLTRKGVFPYEWFDSLKRLNETQLPPIEKFYSHLKGDGITEDDYAHAKRVWSHFGMKSFREYHDLYMKGDALLLADVVENFRNSSMKNYGIDPVWGYTTPGLTWQPALKSTKVELELLTDQEMFLMFERGVRGGISMNSGRYAKANNKYMKNYNKDEESKFITYLDANNLYGWALSQPLPYKGFKWMNEEELQSWENHPCVLDVDLIYPRELHDMHNDYPLAPEIQRVNKTLKLVPNLNNKKNYVIHHRLLKFYLKHGLKIEKINRGIKFEEKPWLKDYIAMNTNLRTAATTEFEKDFFKLMNNAVYGKTLENIRNRREVHLINNETRAKKFVAKTNFDYCQILDEDLVAIQMVKKELYFCKPYYVGQAVLDLSKMWIYQFHYEFIKPLYTDKVRLLYTDTDSLLYEIKTNDFFEDIKPFAPSYFDTTNYPIDHASGIKNIFNKKVLGMFKDEVGGEIIEEFVGLKAKSYSFKMSDGTENKKCKGIKKYVVKDCINHNDYKRCLFENKIKYEKMCCIRSYKHNLFTEVINKKTLDSNDDKRYICKDGISTYA